MTSYHFRAPFLLLSLALLLVGCDAGDADVAGVADVVTAADAAASSSDVAAETAGGGGSPGDASGDAAADVTEDIWGGPWTCPADMVLVETGSLAACVDRYEAARVDAKWYDAGSDESRAISREEVLPWVVGDDSATAEAACAAASKRLCSGDVWEAACVGPDGRAYPYGDTYREDMCNGFETHGPGSFQLVPTGRMEHCESGYGAYDMSGNLWELVRTDDGIAPRGGAFDSTDGPYTHRCTYVRAGGHFPSIGFRCCADPTPAR